MQVDVAVYQSFLKLLSSGCPKPVDGSLRVLSVASTAVSFGKKLYDILFPIASDFQLVVVGADQEALFQLAKDRPGLSIEKHGLKEVKEEGWDLIVIPAWAAVTAKELKDLFASAQSKIAETGTIAVLCRGDGGLFGIADKVASLMPGGPTLVRITPKDVAGLEAGSQMKMARSSFKGALDCTSLLNARLDTLRSTEYSTKLLEAIMSTDIIQAASYNPVIVELAIEMLHNIFRMPRGRSEAADGKDSDEALTKETIIPVPVELFQFHRSSDPGARWPTPFFSTPVVEAKPASEAKEVHTVAVPDPCFPYGPYGNFVNVGLERWLENRAQWTAREPGFTHPPYPPPVDFDEVYDEMSVLQRTYHLPGPMRLPDMIDVLLSVWYDLD